MGTPEVGTDTLPQQPPEAICALRFFAGPVPAALLLLAILFAWMYPICPKEHQEHLEVLQQIC